MPIIKFFKEIRRAFKLNRDLKYGIKIKYEFLLKYIIVSPLMRINFLDEKKEHYFDDYRDNYIYNYDLTKNTPFNLFLRLFDWKITTRNPKNSSLVNFFQDITDNGDKEKEGAYWGANGNVHIKPNGYGVFNGLSLLFLIPKVIFYFLFPFYTSKAIGFLFNFNKNLNSLNNQIEFISQVSLLINELETNNQDILNSIKINFDKSISNEKFFEILLLLSIEFSDKENSKKFLIKKLIGLNQDCFIHGGENLERIAFDYHVNLEYEHYHQVLLDLVDAHELNKMAI